MMRRRMSDQEYTDGMMMTSGEYYYAPHRRSWGVWKRNPVSNGVMIDDFIADYQTKEEARREVYRLNGWNYKQ